MMNKKKSILVGAVGSIIFAHSLLAIGPRGVVSSGDPIRWTSMPVTVHVESDLDVGGKDVTALVQEALNTWSDLSESDVTLTEGSLGVSVDEDNVCDYYYYNSSCGEGTLGNGKNPLVIDEDGSIFGDLGAANRFTTLGLATIVSYDTTTGAIAKAEALFNAACLNGVMATGCQAAFGADFTGFSDDDFTSFMVHELGHFLGLDHSQVNLAEAEDDDSSNDGLINTMFPIFISGNGGNFKTPNRDDEVGLAQLYPASGFSSSTWTIAGTVYNTDGTTELQCANVVARNAADPSEDAIAAISGDFQTGSAVDGSFEIPGLQPGASYALTVEPISSDYTGSSGYSPCGGGAGSSPPQFTALTSTGDFTASAGETVSVSCTLGGDCTQTGTGASDEDTDSSGGGGSGGGCSLMPQ